MIKTIIILLLILINLNGADFIWEKLLHHKNNENNIISKEFYLSGNIKSSPADELKIMKKLLKNKDGLDIVCNYPARYNYLEKRNLIDKKYELNKCKELQNFINGFSKKNLSIVYTSEYNNNPSSAFGHTMLLFTENNNNIEIGDVIHFAAKTNENDSFFKYSYNGMKGNYTGHFIREKFYKKIYEYNILEQRYMNVYKLNYTEDEILELIYHLYELRKATFKYYFLNGNCATNTTDLLDVIGKEKRGKDIFYLPKESIDNKVNRIKEEKEFKPLLNIIYNLVNKMTKEEKEIFLQIIKNNSEIDDSYSNIIKEAIYNYTVFNFRRYHKIFKNYNNIMSLNYNKDENELITNSLLDKPSFRNITLDIVMKNNQEKINIGFRPLFIDMYDIQNNILQESEIKTLAFNTEIKNRSIKLNYLDLINIKSYSKRFLFHNPYSWEIYSGLDRNNSKNKLKYTNEIALGVSNSFYELFDYRYLISIGSDNFDLYMKPKLNISKNLNKQIKLSGNISNKINIKKEKYLERNIFLSLRYKKNTYKIEYQNKDKKERERYLIGVKYSF